MNLEQFAIAGFVIIGLINGLQFAIDKNWGSFIKFVLAVIAGGLFGFLQWFGLPSIEVGLAVGISSSGAYKIAQKLGGN
jgi:hydrogenase/urease accessory protein HupE